MTNDFPYREELDTAERAAKEAGAAIMGLFKGKYDVQEKSKNNPVTTADLEANRLIREIVRTRFPQRRLAFGRRQGRRRAAAKVARCG